MKKIVFLLFAVLFGGALAVAQEEAGVCGVSTADQLLYEQRLLDNLDKVNSGQAVSDRGATQYVPVHFHLVGDASGNGKIKEVKVLDQLCALNTAFAETDIQFYLSPRPDQGTLFNYAINATNVYSNQNSWFTMHSHRHPNAVNIYIVDEAVSGNNNPGITLAYYSPPRDWIVSRKDRINGSTTNSTLPHEVGHFFSLDHTFIGWESNPFDPTDSTWPIAPATSPGGLPTERMNGTNCNTAADKICDTPPDYNFGLFDNNDCVYDGGAKDPLGVDVVTMENNMMGYFENCSEYVFSPQQQNVIQADLLSSSRNYLDNNFTPAATTINTPVSMLVAPINGQTVQYYDEVLLEWQNVPGATYYLLEIDIINTYVSPFSKSFIVDTNSKLVTDLVANRNYYWRVRPINEYVTCADPRQSTFKTPLTSGVRTIEGLTAWQVSPNPVRSGAVPRIFIEAENNFDAAIQVFDATGQLVYEQNGITVTTGQNVLDLPVSTLQNGLYFVSMQSGNGQAVRKLSVVR